jgi:hypothetical protein
VFVVHALNICISFVTDLRAGNASILNLYLFYSKSIKKERPSPTAVWRVKLDRKVKGRFMKESGTFFMPNWLLQFCLLQVGAPTVPSAIKMGPLVLCHQGSGPVFTE